MLKGKNRLKLLENVNLKFAACFIGSETPKTEEY